VSHSETPLAPSENGDQAPVSLLRALALLGLLLLGVIVWAVVAEYRAEWRGWQARFRDLEARLSPGSGVSSARGIRQVFLEDMARVDRCTTCHLGVDDPLFAKTELPFRTHSGAWLDTHRLDHFGCTSCHGGQGAATTYRDAAHRPIAHWREPMRSPELMEANCGVCHQERALREAFWLSRGRQLIVESNCVGCHQIPGFGDLDLRAPVLDSLGHKLRPGWLRGWLEDPEAYYAGSRMPNFRLEAAEVDALEAFLHSQRAVPPLPEATVLDWSRADAERGGVLFRGSRCVTCHKIKGRGGTLGPELTKVGGKATREWIYSYLKDPFRFQPNTLMLRFRFTDEEVRDLSTYLSQELVDRRAPPGEGRLGEPDPSRVLAGREVFQRRGCYGCHPLPGFEGLPRIGPKLAGIADRAMDFRLLTAQGVAGTVPNWVFTKLMKPETLTIAPRMPTFGFEAGQAGAISVAVSSLRSGDLPASRLVQDPVRPPYVPQGRFGELVRRYRCLSCHQIRGTGGTLSTVPLDRIGSQLRRDYLERYLENPGAVRVAVEERMPKFNLAPEEIRDLADHLSTVLVDDALETPVELDAEAATAGRALWDRLGCQGCHIVGPSGGFVGPDLNDAGRRLKPGWVTVWLLDPESWKPGTLQPDYGLDPDQARALTAYVMTLVRPETGSRPH
jgi:mono/diheme cytochrome c family protein